MNVSTFLQRWWGFMFVTVVFQPIFKICQFVANERHAIATNGVKVGWWGERP